MRDYVTYTTPEGKTVTTKEKVIMGYSSIILLEKTGKDYSSVAIAKTQQNGVIGSLSVADRYSSPTATAANTNGVKLRLVYGLHMDHHSWHQRYTIDLIARRHVKLHCVQHLKCNRPYSTSMKSLIVMSSRMVHLNQYN